MYKGIGQSHVTKVNIGWAVIIAAGIGSFVIAKNAVLSKRQAQIQKNKDIIAKVEREILEEK